ncbi:disulfide bond formation protein B [Legionella londiniensis]|uniref:Transmembrane protein n=1 Tax=Legionella londiniensis TaxID=45068 RepID=A0A0W0VLM6_9GAMM|nr:disulfide bond formation protein B [Legionella londiniensis]KTD21035.1 transmembrane protein [Legionella londiniensis]STX93690.1 inner (transmembrane) protein [Legionella londiniensis]
MTQNKLHVWANIAGLVLINFILIAAFIDQLLHHDLPCPLCLLQRIAFVAVGLCLSMNLKLGIKASHYGLMILSALLGFAVALRQIFLHISPGDPGYGPLFFNLHLYTWSAIIFFIIIGLAAIGLLLEKGFGPKASFNFPTLSLTVFFLLLILANGISTLLECGFLICPSNPVRYFLFDSHVAGN